jgi:tRNA dimethylallyltransferase
VRALELTDAGASLAPREDRLWAANTRRPTLITGLRVSPETLTERIERRTREMFARGVVDEVRSAGEVSATAAQALGLREVLELAPEDAEQALVARTLRYAAYQRKWMRRIPGIGMIDAEGTAEEVANAILEGLDDLQLS